MTWSLITFVVSLPSRILAQFKHLEDTVDSENPLLKNNTSFHAYATSHARYPSIRTFYHAHAHAKKLHAISDLPLIVFVHGLGGSLAQFAPLLGSFVNIAPIFGIELPGHGRSDFAPQNFEAYTFEALVELYKIAIEDACTRYGHHKIIFICHSMGCSIGAMLSSAASELQLGLRVEGLIAICPKATPPNQLQSKKFRRLLSLPNLVLDVFRWYDRLGGLSSNSVKRFVGEAAGIDLKRLQLNYNKQFRTPVWKRVSLGCLPDYDFAGNAQGGLPGQRIWQDVKVPLYLIVGESDAITKPAEALDIIAFVQGKQVFSPSSQAGSVAQNDSDEEGREPFSDEVEYGVRPSHLEIKSKHSIVVRSAILPNPASHALMYDHATHRTVAGLIENFLSRHISHELELGWQLQQLTTTGKWDVKNLEKWQRVTSVSGPIAGGIFRSLKTLREQDHEHTPSVFLRKWAKRIFAVIDISHEAPVYDTKALEKGGVQYHKFPTVSKIPPTLVEVHNFIALVDRLQDEIESIRLSGSERPAIGVHCHYGFNRTGFFIVCYLVEKLGWSVQDAVDEFAKHKPPGIKHDHFIDTLFVRYCVGLKKSSTFS